MSRPHLPPGTSILRALWLAHPNSLVSTHQAKCHPGQVTKVTSWGWPSPSPDLLGLTAQCFRHTAQGHVVLRQRGLRSGHFDGKTASRSSCLPSSLFTPVVLPQEAERAGRGGGPAGRGQLQARLQGVGGRAWWELISRHHDIYQTGWCLQTRCTANPPCLRVQHP